MLPLFVSFDTLAAFLMAIPFPSFLVFQPVNVYLTIK